MKNDAAIFEGSWAVTKLNILLPYDTAILLLGMVSALKNGKLTSTQNVEIYISFIQVQNMKVTKMSFSRWVGK